MKHVIFSKQCDHDLDLVPFWFHYYKHVYRADTIVLTPVKTRLSEIRGVCEFYRAQGVDVVPIELDSWDDETVWRRQLEILAPRVHALGDEFTAVSADTDQFFEPLDAKLVPPDVVFRRLFVYADSAPTLTNIANFAAAVDFTYDLVAGFVNTLENRRVGPTGHFHGLVPRTTLRPELHFAFRGSKQFQEKVAKLAVPTDGRPGASHWKGWKQIADHGGESGIQELLASMSPTSHGQAAGADVLSSFLELVRDPDHARDVRCPCPFGSQVMQNVFVLTTPSGTRSRTMFYPLNELDDLVSTLTSGIYDLPPGISPRRVLDVGAHVGGFAALMKSLHPEARIVCFEGTPDTASLLRGNFTAGEEVRIENAAVAEQSGMLPWYTDPFAASNDSLELVSPRSASPGPVPSFDSAELLSCFQGESIDVLKISANGSELRILQRGAEVLRRVSCLFVRVESAERRAAVLSLLSGFSLVRESAAPRGAVLAFVRRP